MNTRSGSSQPKTAPPTVAAGEGSIKAQPIATVLLLTLVGSIVFLGYVSVIFNFFVGDDFVHLEWLQKAMHTPELIWRNFHTAWLEVKTARFYRPLISLFMVLDYSIDGPNAIPFHLDNLFFLITSSLALFAITVETRLAAKFDSKIRLDVFCPLAAGLFFGLYPLHPEAVSWITGRVDAICTAFTLLSFWLYLKWRSVKLSTAQAAAATSARSLGADADEHADADVSANADVDVDAANQGSFIADSDAALLNEEANSTAAMRFKFVLLPASLFFFGLALLSKEMAITLPPTLIAYELFMNYSWKGFPSPRKAFEIFKPSLPYWLLFAVYFAVRTWALGTAVGGYDDSLFRIADWNQFINGWIHSLRVTFIPINKTIISDHHVASIVWSLTLYASLAFVAWKSVKCVKLRRCAAFAVAWFGIALLPVYKIFYISDDLQGARFAFMATVPLCLALAMTYATLAKEKKMVKRALYATFAASLVTLFTLLQINNSAWVEAGNTSNAIRSGLNAVYSEIKGDPQVLFVGLPDQLHGAYICRNALQGMTKRPQFFRDVQNGLMINNTERVIPFGFLKKSILDNRRHIFIERWDSDDQDFDKVDLDYAFSEYGELWRDFDAQELNKICSPGNKKSQITPITEAQADAPVDASADSLPSDRPAGKNNFDKAHPVMKVSCIEGSHHVRPSVAINSGHLTCFDIDFVEVVAKVQRGPISPKHTGVDLFCTNDYFSDAKSTNLVHQDLKEGDEKQRLIYSLRSNPEWALGGNCRTMNIDFPEGSTVDIYSIRFLPAEAMMPIINFEGGGYLGSKGFMHIGQDKLTAEVAFDTSKVSGATGIIFEINPGNVFFDSQNTSQIAKNVFKEIRIDRTSGSIPIDRKYFPALGLFEGRAWAIDEKGHRIGVAGDHIVFGVDS